LISAATVLVGLYYLKMGGWLVRGPTIYSETEMVDIEVVRGGDILQKSALHPAQSLVPYRM
jgi:hypothetical protein